MNFYWRKTPKFVKKIFKNQVWDIPNTENYIYLTFDDGPVPEITNWVLDMLENYQVKASFFCIGDNINKFPDTYKRILQEGHAVGNHTYNHLNGWKTTTKTYLENVQKCAIQIDKFNVISTKVFRPPYGKIGIKQSVKLRRLGYKIIMWDVLSADFDNKIFPEDCLNNVIKNTKQGSIIVFHDSEKAFHNLKNTLPKAIEILKERGFVFKVLS